MMQKNVASQKWVVFAFDETDNTAKTGDAANITANLRIDGAAADAVDDTNPTELEDGYYVFDLTQAETNGDYILICPSSSTANIQVIGVPGAVWTTPANYNAHSIDSNGRVDVIKVAGTTQTANDNGADINAILVDTGTTLQAELDGIQADTEDLQTQIGTAGAGLTDLGGMSTGMKEEVNAEVDTALNTAIPGSPTADSINERVKAVDDLTQSGGSGDLAAIKTITDELLIHSTTIASVTDDKTFTLTDSGLDGDTSADDDAWNNASVVIKDVTGSAKELRKVSDYGGVAKQIILDRVTKFNLAAGDEVRFYPAYVLTSEASISEADKDDIVDKMCDEAVADHQTVGTVGYRLDKTGKSRYDG